jgi:hypothetical protein
MKRKWEKSAYFVSFEMSAKTLRIDWIPFEQRGFVVNRNDNVVFAESGWRFGWGCEGEK